LKTLGREAWIMVWHDEESDERCGFSGLVMGEDLPCGSTQGAFWFGGHEYECLLIWRAWIWISPVGASYPSANMSQSFFFFFSFFFFLFLRKNIRFYFNNIKFPKLRLQLISWGWWNTMFFVFIFFKWTEAIQKIWKRARKRV